MTNSVCTFLAQDAHFDKTMLLFPGVSDLIKPIDYMTY